MWKFSAFEIICRYLRGLKVSKVAILTVECCIFFHFKSKFMSYDTHKTHEIKSSSLAKTSIWWINLQKYVNNQRIPSSGKYQTHTLLITNDPNTDQWWTVLWSSDPDCSRFSASNMAAQGKTFTLIYFNKFILTIMDSHLCYKRNLIALIS